MNERIEELAEQAWKELAEQAWNATAVSPEFGHPVSFAEKLAELIVRECADVTHRLIVEDGKEFPVKSAFIAMSVAYRLKEHFGVKE